MSLSHAKGLPSNQHRVLADGTPDDWPPRPINAPNVPYALS
jgi:hypothetical protein